MIKKAVIFCGGKATRFNNGRPGPLKPLIKINNEPIIIKIINIYAKKGVKEFILLGGYKFKILNQFFKKKKFKNLNIKVIDTGINTETAGRLLKARKIIGDDNFFLTYGDSLTDFEPAKAYKKFCKSKRSFLISIYKYTSPYGVVKYKNNTLNTYYEKKYMFYINAGFYIFNKKLFKFIKSKHESLEKITIPKIIKNKVNKFLIYKCKFWHPMDDKFDKSKLSQILKK